MRSKLSSDQLLAQLPELPGWSSNESEISKTYEFETYKDGLVFASAVGFLADKMDHHPDLAVGYRKVGVVLSTHDAGGITDLDIELAKKIESL